MVLGISKIDRDGLGMTDMQITVGFRGEPGHHPLSGSLEVFPPVVLVDLGVLAGCMQSREETFLEERCRVSGFGGVKGDLFGRSVGFGGGGFRSGLHMIRSTRVCQHTR